eukprot:GCRY01002728.1.p1 GENE.GCRY01002728.1~~GCRY01002728.1.p1  ORF type:complete len:370 (+),score=4.11 GCRY01002728.1:122-1231(+)
MSILFDAFLCDPIDLNEFVFELWTKGMTVQEAARSVYNHPQLMGLSPIHSELHASYPIILGDIEDQYRQFLQLEHFLHNPPYLQEQGLFPVSERLRRIFVEKYYDFDASVARELFIRRLSSKTRKDLAELSEATNRTTHSCKRQFDNFRRVYKCVSDAEGSVVNRIQELFHFSQDLANRYARVLFIIDNKIETSKGILHSLHFQQIDALTKVLFEEWTDPSCQGLDLDTSFIDKVRDVKALIWDTDSIDEYAQFLRLRLSPILREDTLDRLEARFKPFMRGLLTIGAGLVRSREFRDVFLDLAEKIVVPLHKMNVEYAETDAVFVELLENFVNLKCLPPQYHTTLTPSWARYLAGVHKCVKVLYNWIEN